MGERAQENDSLFKERARVNADRSRLAREPEVELGDEVFMRREKRGKLDTNFGSEKYTITEKQGSDIVCRDKEGSTVRRNVTFAKVVPKSDSDAESSCNQTPGSEAAAEGFGRVSSPPPRRSQRSRKPPDRYGTNAINWVRK